MLSFTNLPQTLQEFLADPRSSTFVVDFLKSYNKNTKDLTEKVSQHITDCIYGNISIEQMLTLVKTTCLLSDTEVEVFFEEFLNVLEEKGLDDLEKNFSSKVDSSETHVQKALEKKEVLETVKELRIDRDPQTVQTKLLQVLERFNLHVDEKGIVAYEVERYLKGEVLSRDLVPHLTAMLDKPLSEVQAIITALNTEIFKPIQKQIAEEGTIDISYENDAELQNVLVPKKTGVSSLAKKPLISFLPKETRISQEKRADVLSDLKAQGGTPTGTSLLSQEVEKGNPQTPQKEIDVILPNTKKYTIDPYREIV